MSGGLRAALARVLVVEDHAVIALNLQMMLENLGVAEIELTASVAGALEELDRANFDLAVVDIDLGGERGLLVADRCAERSIPVIISTGYAVDLDRPLRSTEQLLAKSYNMKNLELAVERAINRAA